MAEQEFSFEDFATPQPSEPSKGPGISFEEFARPERKIPSGLKESTLSFMTGVGKTAPFGQDIPAAINVARSYLGGHPAGVPTEGSLGERFSAAKEAQMEAAKILGEKAPTAQTAGMATGIAGSFSPLARVGAAEEAIAQGAKNIVPQAISKIFPKAAPAIAGGASKVGTGATVGALYGAGEGVTPQERMENALSAAKFGAAAPAIPAIAETGAKAAGALTSIPLYFKTGESFRSLNDAVKAGLGKNPEFWSHLTGAQTGEDLVNRVQGAVSSIADQRSRNYMTHMNRIGANQSPLDYSLVEDAINKAKPKAVHLGKVYDPEAYTAINEAENLVSQWKNQGPSGSMTSLPHSIEDFDKLKRALDNVHFKYSRDYGAQSPAARAISDIRRSVFNTIEARDPSYANAMEEYAKTSNLLKEIGKEVTGAKGTSVGAKIRKVLRARDSEHKGALLDELAKFDKDIPYAISGHELSSLMPQGIRGAIVNAITASGGFLDPSILTSLVLSSPKVAGSLQYGIGRAGGLPAQIERAAPGITRGIGLPLSEDREGRATGGRTNGRMTVAYLLKMAENSKKKIQNSTEQLLDHPDESVVSALKVANKHI